MVCDGLAYINFGCVHGSAVQGLQEGEEVVL